MSLRMSVSFSKWPPAPVAWVVVEKDASRAWLFPAEPDGSAGRIPPDGAHGKGGCDVETNDRPLGAGSARAGARRPGRRRSHLGDGPLSRSLLLLVVAALAVAAAMLVGGVVFTGAS